MRIDSLKRGAIIKPHFHLCPQELRVKPTCAQKRDLKYDRR